MAAGALADCGSREADVERAQAELARATAEHAAETVGTARAGGAGRLTRLLAPPAAPPADDAPGPLGGLALAGGDLVVADARAIYRVAGGKTSLVATVDDRAQGGDRMPLVLAATSAGTLYVASPDRGEAWRVEPGAHAGVRVATGLARPTALAALPDGSLAVLESSSGRITRVDREGKLELVASGLSSPVGLGIHGGRFFVAEASGGRVVAARPGGPPAVVASGFATPVGATVDRAGHAIVAEGATGSVLRAESDATRTELASGLALRRSAGGEPVPVALAVDETGAILVVAPGDGSVWRIDAD